MRPLAKQRSLLIFSEKMSPADVEFAHEGKTKGRNHVRTPFQKTRHVFLKVNGPLNNPSVGATRIGRREAPV